MDVEIHHLLMMFLALQGQYDIFLTDRLGLMREMNLPQNSNRRQTPPLFDGHNNLFEPRRMGYLQHVGLVQPDDLDEHNNLFEPRRMGYLQHVGLVQPDDLDELTEIHKQLAVLEENLQMTLTRISGLVSPTSRRHLQRQVRILQRKLRILQAEVRAAFQHVMDTSARKVLQFTFSHSMEDLNSDQVKIRDQLRFNSLPDLTIPEDCEDYDHIRKWKSENRTIEFKRQLDEMLQKHTNALETLRQKHNDKWPNSLTSSYQSTARDTACTATNHSSEQTDPGNDPPEPPVKRYLEDVDLVEMDDGRTTQNNENDPPEAQRGDLEDVDSTESDDWDEENDPSEAQRGDLEDVDSVELDDSDENVARFSHGGTSAQRVLNRPTVRDSSQEVKPKTVSTKKQRSGSQSFHMVDINTVLLTTMSAVFVTVFMI